MYPHHNQDFLMCICIDEDYKKVYKIIHKKLLTKVEREKFFDRIYILSSPPPPVETPIGARAVWDKIHEFYSLDPFCIVYSEDEVLTMMVKRRMITSHERKIYEEIFLLNIFYNLNI